MKEISILYLLKLLKKNLLVILLTAVVFAAATFSYCYFLVSPRYSASAAIIISNGTIISSSSETSTGKDLSSDISASIALTENCIPLLQSPSIYKLIAAESNIADYNSIRNSFKVSIRDEGMMIIDITATAESPEKAVQLVNNFTKVCPEYISNIFKNALVNPFLEAEGAIQVAPRTTTSTMIGAIIGFILAVLVFFIIDMFDPTIHTEDELTESFALPILGVIPDFLTAPAGGYNDGDK